MSGFELNRIYRIEDVVQWVKNREDRRYIYALYSEQGTDELAQGMRVLVGETPSFDEDDNEVMPPLAQTLGRGSTRRGVKSERNVRTGLSSMA